MTKRGLFGRTALPAAMVSVAGLLGAAQPAAAATTTLTGQTTYNVSGTQTESDQLVGPGSVEVIGGGSLRLTDPTNSYLGGTLVRDHSTIRIDDDGELGAVTGGLALGDAVDAGRLQARGSFDLDASRSITLGAAGGDIDTNGYFVNIYHGIAGPGALHKDGSGLLGLFGANTFNGLDINGGEVQLGDIGLRTSLIGDVSVDSATLYVYNADLSQVGTIQNTGGGAIFYGSSSAEETSIENGYGGVTYFYDQSDAGSAVIINDNIGATVFADQSSAGSASIALDAGAAFFYDDSTAGTATITATNGSRVQFGTPFGSDAPSAGHAAIDIYSSSGIEFDGYSTAGAATITIHNGGAALFYDSSSGGTARLKVDGSGYIDFSDDYGPNGDGRIPVGSIEGSGEIDIGAGNQLVVGGNGLSTTFSGVIHDYGCGCSPGPGDLEKTGAGTLTLSGTNIYTGSTVVSGGGLIVNGSIADSSGLTAGPGTTIGGVGQLPTTILNGAVLAPGNSIGTITVNGDLSFDSASTYAVQLSPTSSDLVDVTGIASLAGAVVASNYGSGFSTNSPAPSYTILHADGGLSGAFSSAITAGDLGGRYAASLSYDAQNVYLSLITLRIDTSKSFFTSADPAAQLDPIDFDGGVLRTGATTFTAAVLLDPTGGYVDTSAGNGAFTGQVSGDGALTAQGGGTFFLTGANIFTGGLVADGATIAFNADAALGDGSILADNGGVFAPMADWTTARTLAVGAGGGGVDTNGYAVTFTGAALSGSGAFTKSGAGNLTLSGTSAYTGSAVVSGGSLIVNGSIADSSSLTAGPGTTIGGVGQLPTTILNGAVLAPGNSIGTITVDGDLSFDSASTYAVQLSPTSSDLVDVTGAASLAGTVVASDYGSGFSSSAPASSYTILHAGGGVSGAFSSVTIAGGLNSRYGASLSYDAQNVYLILAALRIDTSKSFFTSADPAAQRDPIEFDGGVLRLGGTTFTADVLLDPTGGYVDTAAGNGAFTGQVSGDGALTAQGGGTFFLTGSNTFTGRLTADGSTIAFNADAALGDGSISVANGGTFTPMADWTTARTLAVGAGGGGIDTNGYAVAFTGAALSGAGAFTKSGAGNLTLSGTSAYTGSAVVSGGSLIVNGSIADSSSLTAGPGTTIGGVGQLPTTVLNSATLTPGNSIGTITVNGDLTFDSASTYAVQLSPTSSDLVDVTGAAALAGTVVASDYGSGFSSSAPASSYTILHAGGGVSGAFSSVTIAGGLNSRYGASLSYDAQNVYLILAALRIDTSKSFFTSADPAAQRDPIEFDGGVLRLGGTTFTTAVLLDPTGGYVDTSAGNGAFTGQVSGGGALTAQGGGTFFLTGSNTFTGGLAVNGATVAFNADAALGDGSIAADNGGAFTPMADWTTARTLAVGAGGGGIDTNGYAVTFTGAALSGSGVFTKSGAGLLTLNGDSSGFDGSTSVTGGLLMVGDAAHHGAMLGGDVTVASGGAFGGHGTLLGSLTNNGVVAPGGSIGTLTVNGDFAQGPSGTLLVEVSATDIDKLVVTGQANLDGAVVFSFAPGTYTPASLNFLTAASVTGSFASVSANSPSPFLTSSLSVGAGGVELVLAPKPVFAPVAGASSGLAGVFDAAGANAAGGDIGMVINELLALPAAQVPTVLGQMTGQQHATLRILAMDGHALLGQAITRRLDDAWGDEAARGAGVWLRAYGVVGSLHSDAAAEGTDYATSGLAGGVDHEVSPGVIAGASFGYSHSGANFDDASGGVDSYTAAAYGGWTQGALRLAAVASYGWIDTSTHRRIDLPQDQRRADSDYDGHRVAAYVEGAWTAKVGALSVEPTASLQYARLKTEAFTETGADTLNLHVAGDTFKSLRSGLGLRVSQTFVSPGGASITPEARAFWTHEFDDDGALLSAALDGAPGAPFAVRGLALKPDSAVLGAGVRGGLGAGLQVFADYDAKLNARQTSHGVTFGLRMPW